MNDRIKCPKCNLETFENPRYISVRGEMILFDGKCTSCGYDITAEEIYMQLWSKFDFEKDFDDLEKPLENILDKSGDGDSVTKEKILKLFVKVYDEKSRTAESKEDTGKYFYKKIKYQQILEEKEFSGKEILRELAHLNEEKKSKLSQFQAIEYYKQVISLDPKDPKSYFDLARVNEEKSSQFDEAINNYNRWYELSLKNCDEKFRPLLESEYLKILARLHLKKGIFEKALDFIKKIDLKSYKNSTEHRTKERNTSVEKLMQQDVYEKQFPFPVQVKGLELRIFVESGDYEGALKVYDEIEKLCPNFMEHYCYKRIIKATYGDIDMLEYFDFYDDEDEHLFASMTKLYWETGKPPKIGEIYKRLYDHQDQCAGETWGNIGDYWTFNLFPYLLAMSMFRYLHTVNEQEVKNQLIKDCLNLFQFVIDYYGCFHELQGHQEDVETVLVSLSKLMLENCLSNCHYCRGELYELLGDYERAFVEYKIIEGSNQKAKDKAENLRNKFLSDLRTEIDGLAKIETKEIPLDTTKRIISLLGSIKNSFPEHYEKTRQRVELYGKELPHDLLNPLRITAEEFFNKIYENKKLKSKKSPRKLKRKDFLDKVEELRERNIINFYIESLLRLIWSIGSKGSHPPPKYVKEFKLEDIEVIISAVVTFLRWYSENIQKQK